MNLDFSKITVIIKLAIPVHRGTSSTLFSSFYTSFYVNGGNGNVGRQTKYFFLILIFYQAYLHFGDPVYFYFR